MDLIESREARLSALRQRRQAIDEQIQQLEKEAEEERRLKTLRDHYVQVVCLSCEGAGEEEEMGGFDGEDPPFMERCRDCESRGWLWARAWSGEKYQHIMQYDERKR